MKTDPQTNQEMMGKRHQEHMVMPTQPTARFVMVKADLALIFFKNSLDSLYANDKKAGEDLLDG